MSYNENDLSQAAKNGSQKVSKALSLLAKKEVLVEVSKIETIPIRETLGRIRPKTEHPVVVYAKVTKGTPGVSLMTINREDALILIDILAQQPVGTTGVLKDIDRSAIKEMLNILSNSYATALSDVTKTELELDVPSMITSERLGEIIDELSLKDADGCQTVIIFETVLRVAPYQMTTTLYFVFDNEFSKLTT